MTHPLEQLAFDTFKAIMEDCEGRRSKIYEDTKGIPTIGIGRNLRDRGLTEDEIDYIFANDVEDVHGICTRIFGDGFTNASLNRKFALMNMAFMGEGSLSGFPNMIAAVKAGDWERAAAEALDSKWAREDVGERRSQKVKTLLLEG